MSIGFGKTKLIRNIITKNWEVEPEEKQFNFTELMFVIQEMMENEGSKYFDDQHHSSKEDFYELIKLLLYRNVANFDSMILLSGDKGQGKSSAAIMMCMVWCRIMGIKFDPKKHIAYTNAQVMEKLDSLEKFSPLICDESINFATSENWAKRENKELKKRLGQIRTKHLFFIMCFPLKIYKVDKTYLQSYVNYWVQIFTRGRAAMFVKDNNPVMDAWRLKDFTSIGSFNEFSSVSDVEKKLKKHPNFWRLLNIPKVPPKIYGRYLKVREANVYDDDNVLKSVSKEDLERALLIMSLRDIMQNDTTLSINRIILHIKNEYGVTLKKHQIESIIADSKMLVDKLNEKAISYESREEKEVKPQEIEIEEDGTE